MTIPLAVVAGIPLAPYRQARIRPVREGWEVRVIPGNQRRRADLRGVWAHVLKVVDQARADGVHLILSHDRENERRKFLELKSRSYRAVWLPRTLSADYGQPAFNTAIDDILAFEECWRGRIRPGISSPLLLPETAFSAQPSVSDVWDRARNVHESARDSLDAIENALTQFRREHWRRTAWRDADELVFTRGSLHGSHGLAAWQNKKLTFGLPAGFHFDVKHRRSRGFSVSDQHWVSHTFNQYTNIDPHGFIRGGR